MREILFRGKTLISNEWVYGYFVKGGTRNCIVEHLANFPKYDIDINTLGQYTGLTDKNGTEIFEGDIVKVLIEPHNTNYAKENDVGVVKFGGDLSYVIDFSHIRYGDEDWLWNFRDRECEVIGNVFDNPELLEKVEE